MSLTSTRQFGGRKLEPIISPDLERHGPVRFAASLALVAGTVLGQITAGVDAIQTVAISGTPTGGVLALSYGGFTTADLAFATITNATASVAEAAVKAALEGLTSIGSGQIASVVRSGASPNFTFTVTFGGTLAGTPVAKITVGKMGLTGGAPVVAVATTTVGVIAGAFKPAVAGAGDGSAVPRALSMYDITTDEAGRITLANESGAMGHNLYLPDAPVYDQGTFRVGDLTGLAGLTLPTSWTYTSGSAADPEGWLKLP